MHTNHRRSQSKDKRFRGHTGRWGTGSKKEYLQIFWSKARAEVRELIRHERYEEIPTRYPDSIMWEIL